MPTLESNTEITVGEKESQEEATLSFPRWKLALFITARKILNILDRFDSDEPYYEFSVKPGEKEKIRLFFFAGFLDRSKWYFPVYSLLMAAIIMEILNIHNLNIHLQIYGLVLDCFGAIIVALGLFRGIEGINRDTSTAFIGGSYGGQAAKNTKELSAIVRKTVDGAWGTVFLLSGFLIQIIAVSITG